MKLKIKRFYKKLTRDIGYLIGDLLYQLTATCIVMFVVFTPLVIIGFLLHKILRLSGDFIAHIYLLIFCLLIILMMIISFIVKFIEYIIKLWKES